MFMLQSQGVADFVHCGIASVGGIERPAKVHRPLPRVADGQIVPPDVRPRSTCPVESDPDLRFFGTGHLLEADPYPEIEPGLKCLAYFCDVGRAAPPRAGDGIARLVTMEAQLRAVDPLLATGNDGTDALRIDRRIELPRRLYRLTAIAQRGRGICRR
jgi:hypothetical protein